jgi:hypothetical protein
MMKLPKKYKDVVEQAMTTGMGYIPNQFDFTDLKRYDIKDYFLLEWNPVLKVGILFPKTGSLTRTAKKNFIRIFKSK